MSDKPVEKTECSRTGDASAVPLAVRRVLGNDRLFQHGTAQFTDARRQTAHIVVNARHQSLQPVGAVTSAHLRVQSPSQQMIKTSD